MRCWACPLAAHKSSRGVGLSAVAVLHRAASHRAAGSARASQPPRSVRCTPVAAPGRRFHPSRSTRASTHRADHHHGHHHDQEDQQHDHRSPRKAGWLRPEASRGTVSFTLHGHGITDRDLAKVPVSRRTMNRLSAKYAPQFVRNTDRGVTIKTLSRTLCMTLSNDGHIKPFLSPRSSLA